jgi:hypothetical protein
LGFFGSSKIKIAPNDFVKTQIDRIFSSNFVEAEKKGFADLSKEISILQKVSLDKYLKERQNVIYNLFQIAWQRTIPYAIFIKHWSIMSDDPRVKTMDCGVYDMSLSRAQQAGMDTFEFISTVFVTQIIPQDVDINDAGSLKLIEIYKSDFTNLYLSFETLIKQYKFIK